MMIAIAASPATAHASCRRRKVYGELYFAWAITAEALNTMTRPTKTSSSVTTNRVRSTLTRLAMHSPLGTAYRRVRRERLHDLFKEAPAVLVTLKLIEAGAGWSEQHDIALLRRC